MMHILEFIVFLIVAIGTIVGVWRKSRRSAEYCIHRLPSRLYHLQLRDPPERVEFFAENGYINDSGTHWFFVSEPWGEHGREQDVAAFPVTRVAGFMVDLAEPAKRINHE